MNTPIALFVYKRLWHTQQTVGSLLKNIECSDAELYIFSDAPKRPADRHAVEQVRNYIRTITGFKQVYIFEQAENLGLANSIISGVTEILSRYDTIIVIEDDLKVSQHFLKYMLEGLELYRDNPKVASIHGYIYPVNMHLPETFFLRGTDCWGWATWKRAWEVFEPDSRKLLNRLNENGLDKIFNYNDAASNIKMLNDQIEGKNDSWAIRWHASAFLENMYTLFPGKSLVRNIGMDGQGTHGDNMTDFDSEVSDSPVEVKKISVEENPEIVDAVRQFYLSIKPTLLRRIKWRIMTILGRK